MAAAAPRPCTRPGCGVLVRDGTGRCPAHKVEGKWADQRRGSRQARGYGAAWERLREEVLRRDRYLCMCDACRGGAIRLRPATEVDHHIPKARGGSDDPSNLRAINRECHRRKTLADARQGRVG